MIGRLYDKLFYNGYLAASDEVVGDVVARYSRGNIALQFKRYFTRNSLSTLHSEGDKAAKRLARRVAKASR